MDGRTGGMDFGQYRVHRPLGRGGMGEVYLATDLSLGRQVALKFVSPGRLTDPDAAGRLLQEARAAAKLDHPYICTVHEAGVTPNGRSYIAMQYVEGTPLSEVLARGPLPPRDALQLAMQLAEALGEAHRHGIIHRDLKPGNVILSPAGTPKLVDFGIAKGSPVPVALADAPTVTEEDQVLSTMKGTPAYMSPEQILQRPLDGRTDLFSLGAVLYECLTGRRAFEGPTAYETISKILRTDPLPPSAANPELDGRHDDVCRRLLAKERADRFGTAAEAVGAIRMLLDATRAPADTAVPARPAEAAWRMTGRRRAAIALLLAAGAALAGWLAFGRAGLPPVPPEAEGWYVRGTDAIREGAYFTGRTALEEAVRLFPQYALAYARLAEANAELDDDRAAQDALLRVASLVPAESRLSELERLRLRAVRALVLRDLQSAVATYSQIAERERANGRAWLDLGRAQEAAELRGHARASYLRAIEADRQYAAAHLRLGSLEALEGRHDEALRSFAEAERLYRAALNVEGETEVLLRRATSNDAAGRYAEAQADLTRALALVGSSKAVYQEIRAGLTASSVTASEGRFTEAEAGAAAAVAQADREGLQTLAAVGLVDLAATLADLGRYAEARTHVERALQLAEGRGATRTAARARLQLAAIYETESRPAEALAVVETILPFLRSNQYVRFELTALSIAARAHGRLDRLDEARRISADVLRLAETLGEPSRIALAAANLASVSTALGDYPEALRLRERAEAIRREQGERATLPFDLANRADLLIRLGRSAEATSLLSELEAGAAGGVDAYGRVAHRVSFLRALAAATALDCRSALETLRRLPRLNDPSDSTRALAPALGAFCAARLRTAHDFGVPPETLPVLAREQQYWLALAALERGERSEAQRLAAAHLPVALEHGNDELAWRLAAVAAAAGTARTAEHLEDFSTTVREARSRVRDSWGQAFLNYARRNDLASLAQQVELDY